MSDYVNPESMYPLQTTQPGAGTMGAGTVPGSFLAGTMMPDRMADYRRSFETGMTSRDLANQTSKAQLDDYNAGAQSRRSGYELTSGQNRNKINLLPGQNTLDTEKLDADIKAGRYNNEVNVWKATQGLPEAQRAATMTHLDQAATVLRGLPEDTSPAMQLTIMKKLGVDTSHWDNLDPNITAQQLRAVRSMNPDVFKHLSDMEKTRYTEQGHMNRTEATVAGSEAVGAAHNASQERIALINQQTKLQQIDEFRKSVADQIREANPKWTEKEVQNAATIAVHRMMIDPNVRFNAQSQEAARGTSSTIKSLTGQPLGDIGPRPIPGTTPQQVSPALPEGSTILNKNPDGSVRFKTKDGRIGTWRPD